MALLDEASYFGSVSCWLCIINKWPGTQFPVEVFYVEMGMASFSTGRQFYATSLPDTLWSIYISSKHVILLR